jgi:hypothetical protein
MGLLFAGVLAGILIGYGLLAPLQASFQECPPQGCFDKIAASSPMQLQAAPLAKNPATTKTKSAMAVKSGKRSAAKLAAKSATKSVRMADLNKNAHLPTGTGISVSDRIAEASDPVLNKAKISIAARMENPASAEFSDMKRAVRMNMIGRPVDTICGHVRGKNASGGDVGDMPFLYLVKDDDAYVVDGKTDSAAAIAYRNICSKSMIRQSGCRRPEKIMLDKTPECVRDPINSHRAMD